MPHLLRLLEEEMKGGIRKQGTLWGKEEIKRVRGEILPRCRESSVTIWATLLAVLLLQRNPFREE